MFAFKSKTYFMMKADKNEINKNITVELVRHNVEHSAAAGKGQTIVPEREQPAERGKKQNVLS
jgi:hypothetical protein